MKSHQLFSDHSALYAKSRPSYPKTLFSFLKSLCIQKKFAWDAAIIGTVTEAHPKRVVAKTVLDGSRVVDLPAGELLPRIC